MAIRKVRRQIYRELSKNYGKSITEIMEIVTNDSPKKLEKIPISNRMGVKRNELDNNTNITLDFYMRLLIKTFNVNFPNRDNSISHLYQIIPHLDLYRNTTIFKFDFENFFNSVDAKNFIPLFLHNNKVLTRCEILYLKKHLDINNTIVGIGLSNCITEILGKKFDTLVKQELIKKGLIYYDRYIDDGIIIFDEHVKEKDIEEILTKNMIELFGGNLKLNKSKQSFNSNSFEKNLEFNINYLGYNFVFNDKQFKTGIEHAKIQKNNKKIEKFVSEYELDKNIEKLILRIDNLYKRTVLLGKKRGQKSVSWQVRGITYNYRQLRHYIIPEEQLKLEYGNNKDYKRKQQQIKKMKENKSRCKSDEGLLKINRHLKELENALHDFKQNPENQLHQLVYIRNKVNITEETLDFLLGKNILEIFLSKQIKCPSKIVNLVKNNYYLSIFLNNKASIYYSNFGYSEKYLDEIIKKLVPTNLPKLKDMSYAEKTKLILEKLH